MNRVKSLFTKYPEPTDLFSLQMRESNIKQNMRTFALIGLFLFAVIMFFKAVYNQQDIINTMNQTIDTNDTQLLMYIQLLGVKISPVRLALLLEFPGLYWILGYQNQFTAPILSTILALESPVPQRVIRTLALLETGLTISPSTTPPTLLQEVLNQVFPKNEQFKSTFVLPQITPAPSAAANVMSIVQQVMPFAMFMLMVI